MEDSSGREGALDAAKSARDVPTGALRAVRIIRAPEMNELNRLVTVVMRFGTRQGASGLIR
jgi:hypothetical protein